MKAESVRFRDTGPWRICLDKDGVPAKIITVLVIHIPDKQGDRHGYLEM
jgi:hypothetical protein